MNNDLQLTGAVKAVIDQIQGVEASCIRISVTDGWVQLDGKVSSGSARKLVRNQVDQIFGVGRVINNLTCPYISRRR